MNDSQDSVDGLIEKLPREVIPSRNLWPGIASRLTRPHRARPMALAAAVAVAAAFLASLFTWAVLQRQTVPRVIQTVAPAAFEDSRDPKYVLARDEVQKTFHERIAMLDPATRSKIEASLASIRQAHEDIRKALVADPQSPLLEQLWESTWHDEFDLYDHILQATEPHITRI